MSLRMRKRTVLDGHQTQQWNLGWRADPDRKTDRADTSAYIHRRRSAGRPAQAVLPVNKGRDEAGDVQRLVENLEGDLAAVRMAGDGEVIFRPGGHREHVRVVRQQHVDGA